MDKRRDEEFVVHGAEPVSPLPTQNMGELVYNSLKTKSRRKVAFVHAVTREELTYEQLLENTCVLADTLRNYGCQKGTVISICSENSLLFYQPIIAAFYIGCVVAPINPAYGKGELLHALNLSKPKILFCSINTFNAIGKIIQDAKFLQKVIVMDLETPTGQMETLNEFIEAYRGKYFTTNSFKPLSFSNTEDAFILCSSGTTGLPKGVLLSHLNASVKIIHDDDRRFIPTEDDTLLGILPFFHGYGLATNLSALVHKRKIVVLPKFEEELFLKTVQDYRISTLYLVPPIMVLLAKSPSVERYDLSSVKDIVSGAAPLSEETEIAVKKRLHESLVIRQGYGLTEVTIAVMLMPFGDKKTGSVGKVLSYMKAKVRDPSSGKSLGPGLVGELCFKGPMVMKGYYGNEEATKNSFDEDAWLLSGDLGYYDGEEYFYVVDRLKELIKYKGFQVAPAELESILLKHPNVIDCGVIGLPDETAGELPLAFVVKRPSVDLTETEVQDFVKGEVSSAKWLRGGVIFVPAIPKNPSGKILRKELREQVKQMRTKLKSKM